MKTPPPDKELAALQTVYSALKPLKPEARRKIVVAIHSLLDISQGLPPGHAPQGPVRPNRPGRKR